MTMPHARFVWMMFLAATLSLAAARPAGADSSFLCENSLIRVKVGDHLTRVAELCGDPDWQQQRMVQRRWKEVVRPACKGRPEVSVEHVTDVLVDEWVYDFGQNHHTRYLRFENGFLASIGSRWIGSW
jgi:hypothetical protein